MRKVNLLNFIVLLSSLFSIHNIANAQQSCAADIIHQEMMVIDTGYNKRVSLIEKQLQKIILQNSTKSVSTIDTIPVVVHVLHTGEAEGTGINISDAQIQSSIDRLNEVFANYDGSGTDSNIRFALAIRDPQGCTNTTAINRIDATGVNDYENVGMPTDATRVDLFDLSRWNAEEYLNFWVVSEINDNNGESGTQGFATMSAISKRYDGVVCMYNNTGYDPNETLGYNLKEESNQNETVIHEFGHYLDLYHTFQGDEDGTVCPADVCGTSGDCCGDTDPHIRTSSNDCWTGNNNSCTGSNYGDVVQNYMAYSSQDCKDQFTANQAARMQAVLQAGRTGLLTSPGMKTITATEPMAACSAETNSTGTSGEYGVGITKIIIGDWITESGSAYEDVGYTDNWCNHIDMTPNTTYSYEIALRANYTEYIRAWIDYDNNGTFTNASELVISSSSSVSSLSGTFTTPSDLNYNTPMRIRFRTSQSSDTDACFAPTYGQAEDYSIYYENNASLSASANSLSDFHTLDCCQSDAQTFTISGDDLINDVDLNLSGTDFEISSDGTNYSNTLTLTNDNGSIQNQPVTIYTRLKSGLAKSSYNDDITIISAPATNVTVSLDGEVEEIDGFRGNTLNISNGGTSNYAVADSYTGITGSNSRTYEAWIKTTNSTTTDAALIWNGINSSGEKWIIRLDDGKLRTEVNGSYITGTQSVNDNNWHHIAVVLDNSGGANLNNTTLYVNGKEEVISASSGTTLSINTAATENLHIGIDVHNRYFEGDFDEVRVWSTARTQSEIRESMHLTLDGTEAGLEAYYQFNETSGTTCVDKKNGHNLALAGTAAFGASTLGIASGASSTVTVGNTGDGSVEVISNNLEIDFEDGSTAPDGDLVIYRLEGQPVNGTGETHELTEHWIIRNFGNNQTGLNVKSIKMTVPTSDPMLNYHSHSMNLYKRASNADGSWTLIDENATSIDQANGHIFTDNLSGFESFSQLTMGSNGSLLPVELVYFSAKRISSSKVLLNWITASELNNKGFEIMRSYDGNDFKSIGFVNGNGTVDITSGYQHEVLESKDAYFQLKQVDHDEKTELSKIQFVIGANDLEEIRIFPNPTKGAFQIISEEYSQDEALELILNDLNGIKLLKIYGNISQINTELSQRSFEYPNGIYLIKIKNGLREVTKLLIIKND